MSKNSDKRKCSAVCSSGRPCRAWAVIESDPPLCSTHMGKAVGAGAPAGNQNAVKHGLYVSIMKADDVEDVELLTSTTLMHELLLTRIALRRASEYLRKAKLTMEEVRTILPVLFAGVRTIAYLLKNIDISTVDWDEVLDAVGEELGIEV